MRRAVITGIGVVSPVGSDLNTFWDRIKNGKSGIRKIQKIDVTNLDAKIGGEITDFEVDKFVPKKEQRRMDDFSLYAMGAAKMAVADSGLDMTAENPERMACVVGSGIGGLKTLETQHAILREKGASRCSPFMIPQMIVNMAGGLIAIEFNLKGPNLCVVTACASATHSIGESLRLIQHGYADISITGGSEASISQLGMAGFCALRALTSSRNEDPEHASRPFDKDRDGFVMGDGAGIVVLEEYEHAVKRGAKIYAEVAGFGMTCDAFHMTAPSDDGEGAARAMNLAMKDAGLGPDGVDYVNAHGTSTELNDRMETRAIKTSFGEHARKIMVSSTKSMTGHLLGAAGGVETAVCALALREGVVPPTINYATPDVDMDLDYVPNTARQSPIRACLNNSFGFGGHNACLLLKKI